MKEAMRRDELGERLQLDFKSELITPPVAPRLEGCFLWCALIRVIPLCRGHETCYSQNGRHYSPCKGCSEPYKNVTISFPYPCSPSYTPTHSTPTPQLVDLPTIVECHKTIDSKTLYKTGNISQMLVCSHDPPDTAAVTNLEEMSTSQQKEYLKKFTHNHGCGWGLGAWLVHVGGWVGMECGYVVVKLETFAGEIIFRIAVKVFAKRGNVCDVGGCSIVSMAHQLVL